MMIFSQGITAFTIGQSKADNPETDPQKSLRVQF